jgi:hypothetical protein
MKMSPSHRSATTTSEQRQPAAGNGRTPSKVASITTDKLTQVPPHTAAAALTLRPVPSCRHAATRQPGIQFDASRGREVRCPGVPVSRCPGVPVSRCPGVPVSRCPGVPVSRCPGVHFPNLRENPHTPRFRRHFDFDNDTSPAISTFETAHRLPDPHLTHHLRLSRVAHHDGLQPTQHTVVWSLPPQGDSEGPNLHLSHSTASKNLAYITSSSLRS